MLPAFLRTTRSLIIQGDAASRGRQWTVARDAYAAALKRRPDKDEIWVQLGHALKELGAVAEGVAAYRMALAICPNRADTHRQLGHALKLSGALAEAVSSYRRAHELDPAMVDALRESRMLRLKLPPPVPGVPDRLRFVNLGTTGLCNASCVHCPTGKATTAHVPRSVMPMPLFQGLIDAMVDLDLVVTDQIAFGLFGDGLVDPLVVERAAYLRTRMPDVRLSVNTNGAAFNPKKHAALRDTATVIALHCESLDPAVYDHLMAPLRAERVKPKMEQLLQCFPGKVYVSVPISRMNHAELPDIRRWFLERGAREVTFDPLSSRCAEDRTVFDGLAFRPTRIRCRPEIAQDLVVDCDGQVLACCQDFQRLEPIGDLHRETLLEALQNGRRHRLKTLCGEGRHDEMVTCSRCFADTRGDAQLLAHLQ